MKRTISRIERKILTMCNTNPSTPMGLYLRFHASVAEDSPRPTYTYIALTCRKLRQMGYLTHRHTGNKVAYTTTEDGWNVFQKTTR